MRLSLKHIYLHCFFFFLNEWSFEIVKMKPLTVLYNKIHTFSPNLITCLFLPASQISPIIWQLPSGRVNCNTSFFLDTWSHTVWKKACFFFHNGGSAIFLLPHTYLSLQICMTPMIGYTKNKIPLLLLNSNVKLFYVNTICFRTSSMIWIFLFKGLNKINLHTFP